MTLSWKEVARLKQTERAEQISTARKLLEDQQSATTESDDEVYLTASAAEIVKNVEKGQWTTLRIVSAYIRRAIKAHEKTNCLTEILFEQALKEASALDVEFATTKRLKGALHGVPMTFKDCFQIEGTDATVGFTRWASRPSTVSAALVTAARAQGAIIIAKTNVPQTMFSFECTNPLFGQTVNPYSAAHTPGGSSGGEAAVLAQNGSALGIGTDIGGSLRIPAGYCGVYSLKPGAGRMTNSGTVATIPGFESLKPIAGPMARTCEDVELACRAFFGAPGEPHELLPTSPYVDPAPLPQKLRFGFYTSDNFCKASPPCARAVLQTVEALRKQGHECVEFEPKLAVDAMVLFASIMSADGYKTMQSHLGPDPKESSLFLPTLGPRLPGFIRNTAAWLIRTFVGDEAFARCLEASRSKSAQELYTLHAQRDKLRKQWYEEIWKKHQLDGIIAPVQASPALPHGATTTLTPLAAMTILFNVIDSPVGVVPVTRVDPALDALPPREAWSKEPGHGSTLVEHELYYKTSKGKDGVKRAPYDADAMKGLPVAVQIVGRSGEDERVLKMMKVVDEALGERDFGPSSLSL